MGRGDWRKDLWHLRHGGISQWSRYRRNRNGRPVGAWAVDPRHDLRFTDWPIPQREPMRTLRVAVIADEFTRLALSYEWEQVEITPQNWSELTLHEGQPTIDLLFVESAWHGNDGSWAYHLTGVSAPRPALVELVETLRGKDVPTVFWNKEDPAHYAEFLDSARLFDQIFTTDENVVADYRRDLGHDRVAVLPFAAQPAIHNPIRPTSGHAERDIGFGGMYFAHKYPQRRAQLEFLLGAATRASSRMQHGLDIFSRYLGADPEYQFPAPFDRDVVGSLSYPQMLSAYRAYKVFLNVNSITDSPSMCARRVFEISACGTPVVSTPSAAIERIFPRDEVVQVDSDEQAEWMLRALVRSPELRDQMVHLAQRRIWSEHTYGHRVDQVLAAVGLLAESVRLPPVSLLVATKRPEQIDHVLRTVAGFTNVDLQLCVLTHGFEEDDLERRAHACGIEQVATTAAPQEWSLGRCLNQLVEMADVEVVTKVDDDDQYGPDYLADQLYAMRYSGAEVVGKHAHLVHLVRRGIIAVRFPDREHMFSNLVMGPTIMTTRRVLREHPFPDLSRGEDTAVLRAVTAAGGQIYSADRFNFMLTRQGVDAAHTWHIEDAEILATSTVLSTRA